MLYSLMMRYHAINDGADVSTGIANRNKGNPIGIHPFFSYVPVQLQYGSPFSELRMG
jgi:hypothetical protein